MSHIEQSSEVCNHYDFNKLSENQKLIYISSAEIINNVLSGKKLSIVESILITCIQNVFSQIEDTKIRKESCKNMLQALMEIIQTTL